MRKFPFPKEEKRQKLHERAVEELKMNLQNEGYKVARLPMYAGDLFATKNNEWMIFEVKKTLPGALDLHPIIQGVGQLLYYGFMMKQDPKSIGKNIHLVIAIPYNEAIWKKYTRAKEPLTNMKNCIEPFLKRYAIELITIEMTEEKYSPGLKVES